jgi:hypothetical protein
MQVGYQNVRVIGAMGRILETCLGDFWNIVSIYMI